MKKSDSEPRIKVMIAEDDLVYRSSVKQFLSAKAGIEFLAEASNGHELLELLTSNRPDIILLDIHMPVLDGTLTLPLIRKMYPDIKVIILSMNNDHSMMAQFMTDGAYAYLTKPCEADIIYQTIYGSRDEVAKSIHF